MLFATVYVNGRFISSAIRPTSLQYGTVRIYENDVNATYSLNVRTSVFNPVYIDTEQEKHAYRCKDECALLVRRNASAR